MKCVAQATAVLAASLENYAKKTRNQAARFYASYAFHDLRKFNAMLRGALEAMGVDPDEALQDCREVLGVALSKPLNEALTMLKSGNVDLSRLVDAGVRLVRNATIYALAFAKVFTLLNSSYDHLALVFEAAAKDLQNHAELLTRLKPFIEEDEELNITT